MFVCLLVTLSVIMTCRSSSAANIGNAIDAMLGKHDAVLVASSEGQHLYSGHADRTLVPASILKIFTSLVAIQILGQHFRFKTEFYLNHERDLTVKGFGDPLLTSEALDAIAALLAGQMASCKDILVDDDYFKKPIVIPGRSARSTQPYDAPNNALSVNFNTVNFKRSPEGNYISAEPQTPLLPFIMPRVAASSLDEGRIMLHGNNEEIALYAGHLIRWFLSQHRIRVTGDIGKGRISKTQDRLVLTYKSNFSMDDIVQKLLLYSNNFMANQLLITVGAEVFGPPGTIDKGVRAAKHYAGSTLNISHRDLTITEGSGISRQNRISARAFMKVLEAFKPYRHLLRRDGLDFYKTGTLNGIRTRAGYIEQPDGRLDYYVIMMNTPGKTVEPVLGKIIQLVGQQP